jgi:hypothetical protein
MKRIIVLLLLLCASVYATQFPLDVAGINAEGESWAEYFEEYQLAIDYSGNNTVMIGDVATVPWYSSSSQCSNAYLRTSCNDITEDDNRDNFCAVTDESSLVFIAKAMRQNSINNEHVLGFLNLADAIPSSYGVMTSWRYGVKDGVIDNTQVNDCAADGDARFIIAAAISKDNPHFNSTIHQRASDYLDVACPDFVKHTFWDERGNGETVGVSGYTFRPVDWYSTGGCNVGTNGNFGWGNVFYTGYFGDTTLAVLACNQHTGNDTYFDIAANTTQLWLAAAGWNTTTGLRFPSGKEWSLAGGTSGARQPVCNVNCPNWEDADAPRAVNLCTAAHYATNVMGRELHPEIEQYCDEWVNATGYTPTTYARQRTTTGGYVSYFGDNYENNGMAAYLDVYRGSPNLEDRHNRLDQKFSDSTNSFDYSACFGVYWGGHAVISAGYALGYANTAFGGELPGNVTINDTSAPGNTTSIIMSVTSDSFTISTTTNESANMSVNWGLTTGLGTEQVRSSYTFSQSLTVTGLNTSTLYYANVTFSDSLNNRRTYGVFSNTTLSFNCQALVGNINLICPATGGLCHFKGHPYCVGSGNTGFIQ